MAAAPDDEDNELNFSDIDSDDDNGQSTGPVIAHKQIAHKEMTSIAHKEMSQEQESPDNNEFEPISPPQEQSVAETNLNKENIDNFGVVSPPSGSEEVKEQQNFEPISPISDNGDNFQAISPPTATDANENKFENISDDEDEKREEEFGEEGKFSPVQESDNELNFDESSNDSGYQLVQPDAKPVVKPTEETVNEDIVEKIEKVEIDDTSTDIAETKLERDEEDIEAPMPSPFSDIGDLEDMPGTDGAIISDILKDNETTEKHFKVAPAEGSSEDASTKVSSGELSKDQSNYSKSEVSTNEQTTEEKELNAETKISEQAQSSESTKDGEGANEGDKEDDQDAGDIIADIFGDSDDEEEFEGFADEDLLPEKQVESDDETGKENMSVPAPKDDESSDDEQLPLRDFVSDFDIMLQKRKEMNQMKRRAKKDFEIVNDNDDIIAAMIKQMKEAAEEDRMLNQCGKAATKKLKMLPSVLNHLKKADLQNTFIDCGVLPAIKEWLTPLPDHALPHINIRKLFLKLLYEFPPLDKGALKVSGIGRAVMLLFKHPKETTENKKIAGKIISNWARPIFNVSTNFSEMSREEREDRDKANMPEAKRRRLSSGADTTHQSLNEDIESRPQKPGDKGWIGRARVPMPSHRDYVNRPVSKVDSYDMNTKSTKRELSRYEKHSRKLKDRKSLTASRKAVGVSLNGSKLAL